MSQLRQGFHGRPFLTVHYVLIVHQDCELSRNLRISVTKLENGA